MSPAPWTGLPGPAPARTRERGWLPAATAAAVGAASALAVPTLPPLRFAYAAPELHVALDTGAAVIGVLAAAIVVRGCRDRLRLDRLAVAGGIVLLAVTSAVLTAMLAVAPGAGPRGAIAIGGTLAGTVFLAVGAFAPRRAPTQPRRAVLTAVALAAVAVLAVVVPVELALGERPLPPPEDLARPRVGGPIASLVLQLAVIASAAVAAVALTRRGVGTGDAFLRRVGFAATFYVFAKVHYLLLPPLGAGFLHVGDLLRLVFYAIVLAAAVREVSRTMADRAVQRERTRIARDFHDGVAQELAFIRRRAAGLAGVADAAAIAGAAERALLDSRWAIEHLARAPGEPLERILSRHASVIAARTGVAVTFTADGTVAAAPEVAEALARILGEAVANAAHGNATRVQVELSTRPLRLRVVDDGRGFDTTAAAPGFGLGGMRQRAALVGAELRVVSGPGSGTEVAVELR